jgi:hypothetical protein
MQLPEQIGCGYCFLEKKCSKRDPLINKAKLGCVEFKHFQLILDIKHLLTHDTTAIQSVDRKYIHELLSTKTVYICKYDDTKLILKKYIRRGVLSNLKAFLKHGTICKI